MVEYLGRQGNRTDISNFSDALAKAVNDSNDFELRKPEMVNAYIVNNCRWPLSGTSCANKVVSHGRRNTNRPHVTLDYIRLLRGDGVAPGDRSIVHGAEQHELSHTLGLGHACFTHASGSTNAMHHSTICIVGNGDRAAGFLIEVRWMIMEVLSTRLTA